MTTQTQAIGTGTYPVFVIEADRECPICEYRTTWYATPDLRPTIDHCPKCRTKFYGTLNLDDQTIELVEA